MAGGSVVRLDLVKLMRNSNQKSNTRTHRLASLFRGKLFTRRKKSVANTCFLP
jgi:hypothetical protein